MKLLIWLLCIFTQRLISPVIAPIPSFAQCRCSLLQEQARNFSPHYIPRCGIAHKLSQQLDRSLSRGNAACYSALRNAFPTFHARPDNPFPATRRALSCTSCSLCAVRVLSRQGCI